VNTVLIGTDKFTKKMTLSRTPVVGDRIVDESGLILEVMSCYLYSNCGKNDFIRVQYIGVEPLPHVLLQYGWNEK
jgi:hypothetical protein